MHDSIFACILLLESSFFWAARDNLDKNHPTRSKENRLRQ